MNDMHLHVFAPTLPGDDPFSQLLEEPPEAVAAALGSEMKAAGVTHALGMGCLDSEEDDDPLGIAGTLAVARHLPGLYAIGVADPRRTDADHLRRVEAALVSG